MKLLVEQLLATVRSTKTLRKANYSTSSAINQLCTCTELKRPLKDSEKEAVVCVSEAVATSVAISTDVGIYVNASTFHASAVADALSGAALPVVSERNTAPAARCACSLGQIFKLHTCWGRAYGWLHCSLPLFSASQLPTGAACCTSHCTSCKVVPQAATSQ